MHENVSSAKAQTVRSGQKTQEVAGTGQVFAFGDSSSTMSRILGGVSAPAVIAFFTFYNKQHGVSVPS